MPKPSHPLHTVDVCQTCARRQGWRDTLTMGAVLTAALVAVAVGVAGAR